VRVKRQVLPQHERSSENCLHCEINEVVREHIEGQENVDIADLAPRMVESVVDLILLAPDEKQGNLLAATIASGARTAQGPDPCGLCVPERR
jgi:hypothetical protein